MLSYRNVSAMSPYQMGGFWLIDEPAGAWYPVSLPRLREFNGYSPNSLPWRGMPAARAPGARRARRLAVQGTLRRLYPSIYTSNLDSPPETIVLRHWQAIVGHLLPEGVISHRSAFDGRPHEGTLSITRGKTRRDLRLPGLTVHIVPGPGA